VPRVRFKPTIPVLERFYALDDVATVIGENVLNFVSFFFLHSARTMKMSNIGCDNESGDFKSIKDSKLLYLFASN
jgi:hypothetical protein